MSDNINMEACLPSTHKLFGACSKQPHSQQATDRPTRGELIQAINNLKFKLHSVAESQPIVLVAKPGQKLIGSKDLVYTRAMDEKEEPSKSFVFPVMKKAIGELFANGTVTKEDLERFQQNYWEQMVPNFSQALKLLDIHDVSRHSVLWSINDRLLEAVKAKIQAKANENGDERKLQKLWQKLIRTGMAYIQHPYMRSAIMMVLGKMNTIKSRYVSLIVENEHLYKDAPLPVLRHIWMSHEKKFNEEVKNVLQTYQNSWFESLLDALYASVTSNLSSNSDTLPLLYWPPRRRRRDNSLLKIVEMIGESQALYEKTLDFLREECLRLQMAVERSNSLRKLSTTLPDICLPPPPKRARESSTSSKKIKKEESSVPDLEIKSLPPVPFISPALLPNPQSMAATALCTVRFDLIMSFNEARQDQMCISDPIHHFVWCMDACIRNKKIDRRHVCELAYHLTRHRRRASVRPGLESEVGLDQDTSADWAPDTDEKVPPKKKSGDISSRLPKHQRAGDKRAPAYPPDLQLKHYGKSILRI
ncbi:unnamed protein product [Dibothriocephalus latus]|uniref:Uncharacterized protein n=1 Tax=Dibothriocephalus latus TaxID=60516 RepID=A0A3P7P558_DIBLA|nr:unnamed protein product [Dibothriocephalus latus]